MLILSTQVTLHNFHYVHYSKYIQIQFIIKYKFQIKFIFSKPMKMAYSVARELLRKSITVLGGCVNTKGKTFI